MSMSALVGSCGYKDIRMGNDVHQGYLVLYLRLLWEIDRERPCRSLSAFKSTCVRCRQIY